MQREESMEQEKVPLLGSSQATGRRKAARDGSRSTLLHVCPYILGNELCERLAYYGLATNLVTYITEVIGGNPASAAIVVAMFEGLCYTTPIIGALLADSVWGRYKTILVFSTIYLVGIGLLTASSWNVASNVGGDYDDDDDDDGSFGHTRRLQGGFWPLRSFRGDGGDVTDYWAYSMLCASLLVIAFGTGGIKPNVSAFGADQFNEANPRDRREKESFFNYFYLSINVGSFIACTVIVYIQDSVSWTIGFAVPGLAMLLAVILFVAGSPVYRHVPPTQSPMVRVVKVVCAAIKNRWKKSHPPAGTRMAPSPEQGAPAPQQRQCLGRNVNGGTFDDHLAGVDPGIPPSASYRWLEDAVTEWQTTQGQVAPAGGLAGYTPKQVEEVKMVLRLLPVFATTVLYWTIYTQMSAMFVQQGQVMGRNVHLHGQTFRIPSASMSIFNTVSIILLIWVYDKYLEPALRKTKHRITLLRRIGWGMVIAAITMLNAALVEWYRLKQFHKQSGDRHAANMSIFWQAPQYVLIGLSEVFTSIGQIEFFYDQAPDVMRSCSMALGLLSTALGSYLAGALTYVVQTFSERVTGQPWLPNDLNKGRLDLFFLFMMAIMIVNTLLFLWVAVKYEYKAVQHRKHVVPDAAMAAEVAAATVAAAAAEPSLQPVASAPMAMRASAQRPMPDGSWQGAPGRGLPSQPQWMRAPRAAGEGVAGDSEASSLDIYGRSLAYVPPSPALPAPFR